MAGQTVFVEGEYPDNRLAILVDRENRSVITLLYLSARYGVFRFSRGNWLELSFENKHQYQNYKYFHASMNRYRALVEIFSYEDPAGLSVSFDDLLDEEVVYEFEEPFWGSETNEDEPYQLRNFQEIVDFSAGYPELYEEFNKAGNFRRASEWAAHAQRDAVATSWVRNYQLRIRRIRKHFQNNRSTEKLFWADHLPSLNIFVEQLFKLTDSIYEYDYLDDVDLDEWPDDEIPEWIINHQGRHLERDQIDWYLDGEQGLTTEQLLNECQFMLNRYLDKVRVVDDSLASNSDPLVLPTHYELFARTGTPFGPGSFSFVIAPGEIVMYFVLETDFGLFYLDESDAKSPEFPIWRLWDSGRKGVNLSGWEFVYIPRRNLKAALDIYQKTRNHPLISLAKEHVLPLWTDELDHEEDLHENWRLRPLTYSDLPSDARYLVDWVIDYAKIFGTSMSTAMESLLRLQNNEFKISSAELLELIVTVTD